MSSPVSVTVVTLNSIKRADNNIYTCKVSETLSYLEFKDLRANSVDPDEVAHTGDSV